MANVKVYTPQGGETLNVDDGGAVVLGDVTLTVNGTNVVITGLPTSDPSEAGALYSNAGVLTLSAG
jgi:hypothetical protein